MPSPTSLAPGYARATYDGQLFPHHMTIPVNYDGVPTPGSEPNILTKGGASVAGGTAMSDLFDLLLFNWPASIHFGLCEFHTVDDVTGADQFIWSFNLNKVGTAGGTAIPTSQVVLNWKTSVGSIYKMYLMEGVEPPNHKKLPPYTDLGYLTLSDYIVSDDSPVYGRQNAYPFTPISWLSKINDKLRKQQGLA